MRSRLFDVPSVDRGPVLSKCRELVPLPKDTCRRCGGATRRESVGQPALFRHGGFGATRMTTVLACVSSACRAVRQTQVDEVRPERRA